MRFLRNLCFLYLNFTKICSKEPHWHMSGSVQECVEYRQATSHCLESLCLHMSSMGHIGKCPTFYKRHSQIALRDGILIDWLIGWLIDWLIDWLTDWLIDWHTATQNNEYMTQLTRVYVSSGLKNTFPKSLTSFHLPDSLGIVVTSTRATLHAKIP